MKKVFVILIFMGFGSLAFSDDKPESLSLDRETEIVAHILNKMDCSKAPTTERLKCNTNHLHGFKEISQDVVDLQFALNEKSQLLTQQAAYIQKLHQEMANLKTQNPPPVCAGVICSVDVFGFKFLGDGSSEDTAKQAAWLACSEKFNLNYQCKQGSMTCRRK